MNSTDPVFKTHPNQDQEAKKTTNDSKFQKYQSGTITSNGAVIDICIANGKDYAIYTLEDDDNVYFSTDSNDETVRERLNEYQIENSKAFIKLKGTANRLLHEPHALVLLSIFQKSSDKTYTKALENYSQIINATPAIKAFIANDENCTVWIDEKNDINYFINNENKDLTLCRRELHKSVTLIKTLLPTKKHNDLHEKLVIKVAAALAEALSKPENTGIEEIFTPINDNTIKIAENHLRLEFIGSITFATAILIISSYILFSFSTPSSFIHLATIAAAGGSLGTFLSVLSRSNKISLNENELSALILGQGIIRVLLGASFGLIALLLAHSGIAFTALSKSHLSLLLIGVIAGFSERLVPDMLNSFSAEKQTTSTTRPPAP